MFLPFYVETYGTTDQQMHALFCTPTMRKTTIPFSLRNLSVNPNKCKVFLTGIATSNPRESGRFIFDFNPPKTKKKVIKFYYVEGEK